MASLLVCYNKYRGISVQKIKGLVTTIRGNFTEIWLGCLLFVLLPCVIGLYTDLRGFLASTVITQTIVLTLFVYKGNK